MLFNTFVKHFVAIKVRLNCHHLELNVLKNASSDLLNLMSVVVIKENFFALSKPYLQNMEQKLKFSMLFVRGLSLHIYYLICRFTCQLFCFKKLI